MPGNFIWLARLPSQVRLTLCMRGNFICFFVVCGFLFFNIKFFKNVFQEYHQSVIQFGSRSGPTFCRAWSGSKLFSKVISRWQKSPLAGKELREIIMLSVEITNWYKFSYFIFSCIFVVNKYRLLNDFKFRAISLIQVCVFSRGTWHFYSIM